jgi:chromosome segregation ATPase
MVRVECHRGSECPYLNGGDVCCLISERDYLSQRLDEMEKVMAVAEAEIEKLRREKEELKEEREALRYELKQMLGTKVSSR